MAMQLDIIKTQTTWNDAAASLNNNFSKINRAVRDGIPVVNTPVDEEMSDTSTNAVQNKVIKKYIDDRDVYLEGYAEGVANDAEAAAKKYTDEKIAQIGGGGGGSIDPALLEGYMPMMREFSDDFNDDFAR